MIRDVPACPACASGRATVVASDSPAAREKFRAFSTANYDGVMHGWEDAVGLTVLNCRDCGHFWYARQPSEAQLSAMYAATSGRYIAKKVSPEPIPSMLDQMGKLRRLVDRVGEGKKTPTLLDFGAGFCRWARAAARQGFQVTAFEPSADRATVHSEASFDLINDLSQVADMRFDAINIEQVLEHVADPVGTLASLRGLCHSRTVLRITVPNMERTWEGHKIWTDWPYDGVRAHTMAPYEHLHGFVPESLRRVATRSGYKEIALKDQFRAFPTLAARKALRRVAASVDTTFLFLRPAA